MRALVVGFGGFMVPITPKWVTGDLPKKSATKNSPGGTSCDEKKFGRVLPTPGQARPKSSKGPKYWNLGVKYLEVGGIPPPPP